MLNVHRIADPSDPEGTQPQRQPAEAKPEAARNQSTPGEPHEASKKQETPVTPGEKSGYGIPDETDLATQPGGGTEPTTSTRDVDMAGSGMGRALPIDPTRMRDRSVDFAGGHASGPEPDPGHEAVPGPGGTVMIENPPTSAAWSIPSTAHRAQEVPEVMFEFRDAMPTGVTVSHDGRVFVCYPRWEDPIRFTVAEIRNGQEIPYPNELLNDTHFPQHLFSVQSVVIDPKNRLWALDTGSINMGPIEDLQRAKLVGIDLATHRIFKTINFRAEVVRPATYLNDIRFDLRRGADGMAFITDSSSDGPNGIIVVDLASGRSWRKLHDHPSTKADKGFTAILEGQPLMLRPKGQTPRPVLLGSDGIAIHADSSRLFYCPLSSRELYSVSVDALAEENLPDSEVAKSVEHEHRSFASDGLESDADGRIYLTDWEHNAVVVRTGRNQFQTLVTDQRMWWPDTLSLATDGYLYFTANQLHRQAKFHEGKDQRQKPYYLFRVRVGAKPVLLRRD
ncbi:MAG: L-dopachrome tautomerase-related protein [Bacillota bacterium]